MRLIKLTEYPGEAAIWIIPGPGFSMKRTAADTTHIHLSSANYWVRETPQEIVQLIEKAQE